MFFSCIDGADRSDKNCFVPVLGASADVNFMVARTDNAKGIFNMLSAIHLKKDTVRNLFETRCVITRKGPSDYFVSASHTNRTTQCRQTKQFHAQHFVFFHRQNVLCAPVHIMIF